MSDSTYDILKTLQDELRQASSPDERAPILRALLDAHLIDRPGELAPSAETHDPEDLLAVGASLAGQADETLRSVPLAWFEAAPTAARLQVLTWILPTLWAGGSPSDAQVDRLRAAFEVVDPTLAETREAVLGLIEQCRAASKTGPQPPATPRASSQIPELVASLDEGDPGVRVAAASGLGDLLRSGLAPDDASDGIERGQYTFAVDALLRQATRETDVAALEAELYTLAEAADRPGSGAAANWDPIVPLLDTLRDPECLGHAISALGAARHERYRAAITAFLDHVHDNVREAAVNAIAELET